MKTGLGKGLSALIGEIDEPILNEDTKREDGVLMVDIASIDTDKNQPRKQFDEEKLHELADSIAVHGVMQPLIVTQKNGRYTIVAGERRYRAARMAGEKQVPVLVRELSEQELFELSLIENIQREDRNAIEQANALVALMENYHLTQEAAAKRVGKSRSAIANLVRLAGLPEAVRGMVQQNTLSAGHARALLALESAEQIEKTAEFVAGQGLSVRQTEELVRRILSPEAEEKRRKTPAQSAEMKEAQARLSEKFDTKAVISGSEKKGKIVLEYYSKEQLLELFDRLMR